MGSALIAAVAALLFATSAVLIAQNPKNRSTLRSFYLFFYLPGIVLAPFVLTDLGVLEFAIGVCLGVILYLGNRRLSLSYLLGSTVDTSVVTTVSIVLAAAVGAGLFDRDIALTAVIGAALILTGVGVILYRPGLFDGGLNKAWSLLIAATVVLLAARALIVIYGVDAGAHITSSVLCAYALAALLAGAMHVVHRRRVPPESPGRPPMPAQRIRALFAGAGSLAGLVFYGQAVASGGALVPTMIFGLYPALATLALLYLNRREVAGRQYAGASLALAGVVFSAL